MLTKLPLINEHQHHLLQEAIVRIVEVVKPEKIICYGIRVSTSEMWSCFLPETASQPLMACDLLIITRESRTEKGSGLLDWLSKSENDAIRITPVVHSLVAVYEALQNGHAFFTTVCHKGEVVYDGGNAPITLPAEIGFDKASLLDQMERYWNKWFGLAARFYESARECAVSAKHDVAVFMLHQAVELTCIASIRTYTGYRPTTHNLKRLFSLLENYTQKVRSIFPVSTNEEKEVFNVLYQAYSDVRYREEYKVSADTVFILIERVSEFQKEVEALYRYKVNELS